jgi:hypothetical protein
MMPALRTFCSDDRDTGAKCEVRATHDVDKSNWLLLSCVFFFVYRDSMLSIDPSVFFRHKAQGARAAPLLCAVIHHCDEEGRHPPRDAPYSVMMVVRMRLKRPLGTMMMIK